MSISNLESENNELDARKLVKKISRNNYYMSRYMYHILWNKFVFEQYEREDLLQYADEINLENELSNALYCTICETNNELYNDYYDSHNDIMEDVMVNPMSYAVFIRVNGLPEDVFIKAGR